MTVRAAGEANGGRMPRWRLCFPRQGAVGSSGFTVPGVHSLEGRVAPGQMVHARRESDSALERKEHWHLAPRGWTVRTRGLVCSEGAWPSCTEAVPSVFPPLSSCCRPSAPPDPTHTLTHTVLCTPGTPSRCPRPRTLASWLCNRLGGCVHPRYTVPGARGHSGSVC